MNAHLTLIDAVEAMIAQKRTVGYKYEAEEAVLYRFVTFTRSQSPGLETITEVSARPGSRRLKSERSHQQRCRV